MSRTIYSHLSLSEFLAIVEPRLGKSPIIDELYNRIDLEETRRAEIDQLEEQVKELEDKAKGLENPQPSLTGFCDTCGARL